MVSDSPVITVTVKVDFNPHCETLKRDMGFDARCLEERLQKVGAQGLAVRSSGCSLMVNADGCAKMESGPWIQLAG